MALNKRSKFGADEGLFMDAQQVQEVQYVDTQDIKEVQEVLKEIGTTQGKKGQKLKRINMAFSDINHDYITRESRRQGMSSTAFVNKVIDEYRNKK